MTINISAIIPAYNCEETLARALDSILAQTCPPDEIIIVNDGSTDKTAHLIEAYTQKHPHIHGVNQKNSGPAIARNHGVQLSQNDWVVFLDSDDYWLPSHLEDLIELLQVHPKLAWAATAYSRNNQSLNTKKFTQTILPSYLAIAHLEQNPVHTNTVIIQRSIFWECGGFREDWRRGEDLWLWFQIGLRYPQIGYCSNVSSFYGSRPTSLTNQDFSLKKELELNTRATDQMIQELKAKRLLDQDDVKIFLGNRVSQILHRSLILSRDQYKINRQKYKPFLSYAKLPLRAQVYTYLSFLGISPSGLHKIIRRYKKIFTSNKNRVVDQSAKTSTS